MSIWRLPDARLGTSGGKNEIPEIAVVHESMFRKFALAGTGKYPIAFRSDDRPMAELEKAGGFRPRGTVEEKYGSVTVEVKGVPTTFERLREVRAALMKEASGTEAERATAADAMLRRMLAVRIGNVDLDVNCSVCVTLDYRIAGLFPYDPTKPKVLDDPAQVYVVRMRGWLETYRVQEYLAPHLAYSKEVACLEIPYTDILGCVTVARSLSDKTVTLTRTKVQARPGAPTSDVDEFNAIVATLPLTTTVTVPAQKDDTATMTAAEKYAHIEAALRGLTGRKDPKDLTTRDRNTITGATAPDLPPYAPKKKTAIAN